MYPIKIPRMYLKMLIQIQEIQYLIQQLVEQATSKYSFKVWKSLKKSHFLQLFFRKKESERQLKLNRILLILAFFHFITTLMGNFSFLFNTVYPDVWSKFEGKSTFVTIGNVLNTTNYAKNFYLYCLVHEDIRIIAVSKLMNLKRKLKFWWNTNLGIKLLNSFIEGLMKINRKSCLSTSLVCLNAPCLIITKNASSGKNFAMRHFVWFSNTVRWYIGIKR